MLDLFVINGDSGEKLSASVRSATENDVASTGDWQTDWTTPFAAGLPNRIALCR